MDFALLGLHTHLHWENVLLRRGKQVQHSTGIVTIDKWINFAAPAKIAVLFKELRAKLDRLLADKIKQPELDVWEDGKPLVDAIVQLLGTEKLEGSNDGKRR